MSVSEDLAYGYPATRRAKLRLNAGWRFHLGDIPEAAQPAFDDSAWERVTIPHTFKLTSLTLDGCDDDKTQPTFHREVGWYRRHFTADAKPERKVFLESASQLRAAWAAYG